MKQKLLLLGSSGSIGTQSLDVIAKHPEYELIGIALGHNLSSLRYVLKSFPSIKAVSLLEKEEITKLQKEYPHIEFYYDGAAKLARELDYDMAINAIVGFAGLEPTIEVLTRGKELALANKESLVAGGDLVLSLLKEKGGHIYPIDSEHAAIAKCLNGVDFKDVKKVILTASGGPFRKFTRTELKDVTVERALNHPTWKMGKKITIDSATMVNKSFELLEACYLFNLEPSQVEVLIHPQSLVHSGIQLKDGSFVVDYGKPDMRGPIAYALSKGTFIEGLKRVKSLDELSDCEFYPLDEERFIALKIAAQVWKSKGNRGVIYNAANEIAVYSFLERKLPFDMIEQVCLKVLEQIPEAKVSSYKELAEFDKQARELSTELINRN